MNRPILSKPYTLRSTAVELPRKQSATGRVIIEIQT
jgi:hypothetical protein